MPAGLAEDFRTAGLTHLVAVSGANLAIVIGFVLLLGRSAGLRGRTRIAVAALAMLGFVVLARPQPSVLRAAVMGAVALAALASGRRRRSLAALSATVVGPGAGRPMARPVVRVRAVGARDRRRWCCGAAAGSGGGGRRAAAAAGAALAVPLAAQLVCAPVVVLLSEQVSLVAVPANLLVAPAVAPATVLGVLATARVRGAPGGRGRAGAGRPGAVVWWIVRVPPGRLPSRRQPSAGRGRPPARSLLAVALGRCRRCSRRALARHRLAAACAPWRWPRSSSCRPRSRVAAGRTGCWRCATSARATRWSSSVGPGTAVVVDAGPDPLAVDRCLRRLGVRPGAARRCSPTCTPTTWRGCPGVLRGRLVGEVEVGLLRGAGRRAGPGAALGGSGGGPGHPGARR